MIFEDFRPASPAVLYRLDTPSGRGQQGGSFVPGLEPLTPGEFQSPYALTSFEYTDEFVGLDTVKMTFEDPFSKLCDHPLLQPLRTILRFRFGYTGALTPEKRMVFTRVLQNYAENGKVLTELYFFSLQFALGAVRRNQEFVHPIEAKRGRELVTASMVAEQVARLNGLTPVVTPCRADALSSRPVWRQTNETDLGFLRRVIRESGCKAADGTEGRYHVRVRNDRLYFGPITMDGPATVSLGYRAVGSPLRSFRPNLPGDLMYGMGQVKGYAGVDPGTGLSQNTTVAGAQNPDAADRMQVDFSGAQAPQLQRPGGAVAPRSRVVRDPDQERRRRAELEQQLNALNLGIAATRKALAQQGVSPANIEKAVRPDEENRRTLVKLIQQVRAGDVTSPSPFEQGSQNRADDLGSLSMQNILTANAELFGFPLVQAGDPVELTAVSKRFAGVWWVKQVKHIVNSQGFKTSWDMQKAALRADFGVGVKPTVDLVFVPNYETGESVLAPRPAQGYYAALPQNGNRVATVHGPQAPNAGTELRHAGSRLQDNLTVALGGTTTPREGQ